MSDPKPPPSPAGSAEVDPLSIPCPKCIAKAGQPCHGRRRNPWNTGDEMGPIDPHPARVKRARAAIPDPRQAEVIGGQRVTTEQGRAVSVVTVPTRSGAPLGPIAREIYLEDPPACPAREPIHGMGWIGWGGPCTLPPGHGGRHLRAGFSWDDAAAEIHAAAIAVRLESGPDEEQAPEVKSPSEAYSLIRVSGLGLLEARAATRAFLRSRIEEVLLDEPDLDAAELAARKDLVEEILEAICRVDHGL